MTNKKPAVEVPSQAYRMTPRHTACYLAMGGFILSYIRDTENTEDKVLMWGALLSGLTREMRREFGVKIAAETLRGFADSMAEAAKFDLP